jgi:hypothetical protein
MRHIPILMTVVLIWSTVLTYGQTGAASGTEERVTVNQIVGQVEVRSGGTSNWRPARVGMPVKMGWDMRTYVESNAELMFANGTILKIGENSVVTLAKLVSDASSGTSSSNVKVGTGQIWANVKKLTSAKSTFEFETPTAVASIRGTKLGISVGTGGTSVDVYEGLVMVKRRGSNQETPVGNRQRAVINGQGQGVQLETMTSQKADSLFKDPFAGVIADTTGKGGTDTTGIVLNITTPAQNAVMKDPQVTVKGSMSPKGIVLVSGKEVTVGADGSFTSPVDLVLGSNTIPINAVVGNLTRSVDVVVEYHPSLQLTVGNVTDNMEVQVPDLALEIDVTTGARFSVNGAEGDARLTLKPGNNTITVRAWNQWNESVERRYTVRYKVPGNLTISLTSPTGDTIREPMILVSGVTIPGAKVYVNSQPATVSPQGTFTMRVPLPDEPDLYTVEVQAQLGDNEVTTEKSVYYQPRREPLHLTINSPVDGQKITAPQIRIAGKTSANAQLSVNGKTVNIPAQGLINTELQVGEQEIGDYQLEITASDETGEMTKSLNLTVDGTSPQINTSIPSVTVTGIGGQATRSGRLTVQVMDRTPDDQITLSVDDNGSVDEMQMEGGSRQDVTLEAGKNAYVIKAVDMARNPSNVVRGEIYYLPGPLSITMIEPTTTDIDIGDLPPLPRETERPKLGIELEIEDGINDVPETIKYCRITGMGQSVLLKQDGNTYRYTGEVQLTLNTVNMFTIQSEDLAGNTVTKTITVILR